MTFGVSHRPSAAYPKPSRPARVAVVCPVIGTKVYQSLPPECTIGRHTPAARTQPYGP
jgi:hypothetical protein